MIFLLALFLLLICPKVALAAPSVTLNSVTDPIIIGNQVSASFTINTDVGNTFHVKVVGVGVTLDNLPDSSCDSNYNNCTVFSVGDSLTASINFKVTSGSGQIKIRIAKSEDHPSTYDSNLLTLNLVVPSPTNTPIPTNTSAPTNTPIPSSTSAPSNTTTPIPTSTLKPTASPTRIPTVTPEPTLNIPTPEPLSSADSVLAATDAPVPTDTPTLTPANGTPAKKSKNILPFIFIGAGGLLLLVPIIITKIPS